MKNIGQLRYDGFAMKDVLFRSMSEVSNLDSKGTLLKEILYLFGNSKSNDFGENISHLKTFIQIDGRGGSKVSRGFFIFVRNFPVLPGIFFAGRKSLTLTRNLSHWPEISLVDGKSPCFSGNVAHFPGIRRIGRESLTPVRNPSHRREISYIGARFPIPDQKSLTLAGNISHRRQISHVGRKSPTLGKNVPFCFIHKHYEYIKANSKNQEDINVNCGKTH